MEKLDSKPKVNVLDRTIKGMKARAAMRDRLASRQIFYQAMVDYMEAPLRARAAGKPFGWCEVQAPIELFRGLDVPPFYPEHYSLVVASQGAELPFLEEAEVHHMKDLCSVQKIFIGALMKGELPKPDFSIGVTAPCDAVLLGMQHASFPHKHKACICKQSGCVAGIPIYMCDQPFWNDDAALNYYMGEIRGAMAFMEEKTGTKMDMNNLKEAVRKTQEIFRLHGENNQMRKNSPSPMKSRDLFRQAFIFNNLSGTDWGVKYMQAVNAEMKEMVAKGQGAVPNERIRLGWVNAPPYAMLDFMDEMEKEFGAVVVTDNLSCGWAGGDGSDGPLFPCDPEDPIRSIAAKGLAHYGATCYKDANRMSKVLVRMAKNYHLDGMIFSAHWGCKNVCAIMKHLREDMMNETGIPILFLESDCLDQRTVQIPKLLSLSREYIEMLDQRKA
jgi:benzoyl-CoA reductase/2-hydroxyglutaryl-CoA dehydratase subunit BcrC/BadD/HgdB